MPVDELQERWRERIGWIAEEANYIAIHQIRYRQIEKWIHPLHRRRIVNGNMQAYGWIARLWMDVGLMYVRREIDDQHGAMSLRQLFREMEARPDALVGLTATEVARDRQTLEKECESAGTWAHRQIAHRIYWEDAFVSMGALDHSLAAIDVQLRKYYEALTGKTLKFKELELHRDWVRAFTRPWYKPRKDKKDKFKEPREW